MLPLAVETIQYRFDSLRVERLEEDLVNSQMVRLPQDLFMNHRDKENSKDFRVQLLAAVQESNTIRAILTRGIEVADDDVVARLAQDYQPLLGPLGNRDMAV